MDLHATGTSASGSPVVETRNVTMERDDDATSQDSVTPTQAVPNAPNAGVVGVEVQRGGEDEGEDAYRFNPRESFVSYRSLL